MTRHITSGNPQVKVTSQVGPWAKVPIWVLRAGLSGAELAVYVSLRSYADTVGAAFPRVKTIALRAGVSERTAERGIARMRTLGLLETTRWYRDDKSIGGCHYHLLDVPPAEFAVGTDEDVARGTDAHDARVPTGMSEQEHTNGTHQEEHLGSDDRTAGLSADVDAPQSTQTKKPRKPTAKQLKQRDADYTILRAICREVGEDDPYAVWWTLRLEHKATSPASVMRKLVDTGQWEGFVGRHGITAYQRPGG